MKKTIILLISILLLSGCGQQQPEIKQEQKSVVAIVKAMDSLHWLSVQDGMKKAASEYNIDLTILWPESEDDAEVQTGILEDAISSKPDVIAIAPCDSEGILQYVPKIYENGIQLFYMDEEAADSADIPYIGSDNYYAGEMAGEALAKAVSDGTQVAVIAGSQKQTAHSKRANGFRNYMEHKTSLQFLKICEVPDCTMSGGRAAMRQLLEQYPEIQGVFCSSAMMVMGAMEECRAERRKDIRLVGMDTQSDALAAVQNGDILAMVSQNGYEIGYRTISTIVQRLNGEEISKTTYVGNELITQSNAGRFLKEYVKEGRK